MLIDIGLNFNSDTVGVFVRTSSHEKILCFYGVEYSLHSSIWYETIRDIYLKKYNETIFKRNIEIIL